MKRLLKLTLPLLLAILGITYQVFDMQGLPKSKENFALRFIVTYKASATDRVERNLPLGTITESDVSPNPEMKAFFKSHRIKRMEPLIKEHVKARRQSGKRGYAYASDIRAKFRKRSNRFKGTFNP